MRNKLLQYANLLWGSRNINRFDPAVRLLIESFTQELTKVKQDLTQMDSVLLEELALKLTPDRYTKIRPGYSLLHFYLNRPEVLLTNRDVMGLPEADQKKNDNHIHASFSPLFSVNVYDVSVVSKIYSNNVFILNERGSSIVKKDLGVKLYPLKMWVGLKANPDLEKLSNFSFYYDFPHLKTSDDLFELLPYTKVSIDGREVRTASGLFSEEDGLMDKENEIIKEIYNNQFITFLDDIELSKLKQEKFPKELLQHLEAEKQEEFLSDLEPCYWFCFEFLPNFRQEDLSRITILSNVFPIINKNLISVRLIQDELRHPYVVEGTVGEMLLDIYSIKDSFGNDYSNNKNSISFKSGTYHVESHYNVLEGNRSIEDKLIKLNELLVEQRASFPQMNLSKIEGVINAVAKAENRDKDENEPGNKVGLEEIGRVSIVPHDNISYIDLEFWLTQGELIHKIDKNTALLPSKTSRLYGCNGYLLHRAVGAKQYTKVEDIVAVDKFVFTSRDKVISKQDIINFCLAQYREELMKVEVYLDTKLSVKPKQGYVRVVKVDLFIKKNSRINNTRGILKDLKTRLSLRSPSEYEYDLSIVNKTDSSK